jgi:predicted outer membrane repeat protein
MRRGLPRTAAVATALWCVLAFEVSGGVDRASAAPSVVTVDSATDALDGSCADGDCSLRDAVAVVATGGTVRIRPGYYPLTARKLGSVLLRRAVTLEGTGPGGSFLDATHLGAPAFQIGPRSKPVRLAGLTILGAVIRHDPAPVAGAIAIAGGRVVLDRMTVTGADTFGSAVTVEDPAAARLTIEQTLFVDNRSHGSGAAVNSDGRVRIERTTFTGNVARASGAVAFRRGARVRMRDVTFAGNGATLDGGAAGLFGAVSLRSVSFVRNHAKGNGGAIAGSAGARQDVTARGVLFAGNTAGGYGEQCSAAITSFGYNVEDGTSTCRLDGPGDRSRADARVGGLNSFGGSTPTVPLHRGSDALNVGGVCPPTDQRGAPRSDRCDAGAYERVLCLGRAVNIVGTPGNDDLSGGRDPDAFLGLAGNDEFQGSLAKDAVCGGGGGDHLVGGPGPDRLSGGRGNDRLEGEVGDDALRSGSGYDLLNGGPDRDVCSLLDRGRVRRCEKTP